MRMAGMVLRIQHYVPEGMETTQSLRSVFYGGDGGEYISGPGYC